jgi:hypothetical protein
MRIALAGLLAGAIVLAFGGPPAVPQESPPKKDQTALKVESKRLDGKYDQLKKGMSVDQLVALLGPASTIKTPGDPTIRGAETELRWVDRSTVRVTLKDGKLSAVEASVSPTLIFERVSQENVLKLKPGMAEKEVVEILGRGAASQAGKDGTTVLTWSPIVTISVQLYMGKAGSAKGRDASSFSLD